MTTPDPLPNVVKTTSRSVPTWHEYFMAGAEWARIKSKDPSTQVGCIFIGADKELIESGYNGLPRGVTDLPARMERPAKYLWTSHAEENAIAHAARHGRALKGSTAFVTHYPCCRCARLLIQAGIARIVVGEGRTSMPEEEFEVAEIMFAEAGVRVIRYWTPDRGDYPTYNGEGL